MSQEKERERARERIDKEGRIFIENNFWAVTFTLFGIPILMVLLVFISNLGGI